MVVIIHQNRLIINSSNLQLLKKSYSTLKSQHSSSLSTNYKKSVKTVPFHKKFSKQGNQVKFRFFTLFLFVFSNIFHSIKYGRVWNILTHILSQKDRIQDSVIIRKIQPEKACYFMQCFFSNFSSEFTYSDHH